MTVRVRDVLLSDVIYAGVALLGDPAEVARCGAEFGSEIVQEGTFLAVPSPGVLPAQGLSLRIPRERMLIETSVVRTRFVKEYPADVDEALSVVRLAQLAIPTEGDFPVPSAIGFNLNLVYEQDSGESATHYLATRLFNFRRVLPEPWTLFGGFGKLIFEHDASRWTIGIEPRFQDENTPLVFLDMNVHVPVEGYPSNAETTERLRNVWARAHALIEMIDDE